MGAPPGDTDAPDGCAAARARLPFPAVYFKAGLEQAFEPFAVPVVADSRPLEGDCLVEDFLNGRPEFSLTPAPQAGNLGPGVEPGKIEDLVGIDVSDSGNKPLIEEQTLQPPTAAPEALEEGRQVNLQRLRAEAAQLRGLFCFAGLNRKDEPELSDISKAQLLVPGPEGEGQMHVFVRRQSLWVEQELSGHLKMNDHRQPVREIQQDHLAPPAQADDLLAGEFLQQWPSAVSNDRPENDPDGFDLEADEMPAKAADDCLNLWKLRHFAHYT